MKKLLVIMICFLTFGAAMFAQGITGRTDPYNDTPAEVFEDQKLITRTITPKEQHLYCDSGSVKIEYQPMYDEIRIYYECLYVQYDRGQAMNTVLECLADFQEDNHYKSYRYLKDDKERFFKDDRGRRRAQYISVVKFGR